MWLYFLFRASKSSEYELFVCKPGGIVDRSPSAMANQQQVDSRPWILDVVPFIVVILIAAHVLALVLKSQLKPPLFHSIAQPVQVRNSSFDLGGFVLGVLDLQISDG
ncbi:unnamed protein product [Citrullus colocynthis]|uniref:Uncharacterized protein n=1 Tax=Citrullus colocynthis TaxID=252529 RepID=A0ABP0YG14_9ROSI